MRLPSARLLLAFATGPLFGTSIDLFHYDTSAPLDIHEVGVEQRGAALVHDITFVGVKDPIKAYLVTPAQPGPHAAILYVHGSATRRRPTAPSFSMKPSRSPAAA